MYILCDGEAPPDACTGVKKMENERKTKQQLIEELSELRFKVAQLKTGRAAAERALRESEEKFSILSENSDIVIFLIQEEKCLYVNPPFTTMTGYTLEDLSTMNFWDIVSPDMRELAKTRALARQRKEKVPSRYDLRFITKSGEERYGNLGTTLIAFNNNPAILGFALDVTDRKHIEKALKESEKKFRGIFENTIVGIYQSVPSADYLMVNHAFARIFGYDSPEDLMMSAIDIRDQLHMDTSGLAASEKGTRNFQLQIRRKDGSTGWVSNHFLVTEDEYGNAVGFEGVLVDITEQKGLEEALRESETQYRTLFDSASDSIFLAANDRFIDCNRKALDMFGCTKEQIVGQSPSRFSPPLSSDGGDSRGRTFDKITAAMAGDPQFIEWKLCRYDGTPFDAEVSLNCVELGGGRLLQAIIRDVTDRKRAEQSLRESENKFRVLAEKALVGIYLVQDGLFRYVNARFAETVGYPIDDITDKIGPKETALPEDWPMVRENMRKRLSGEAESLSYEFRTLTKDDEIRNVEIFSSRILYQDRPAILGTLLDITERKRAQEALRASEARYRTLLQSIRDRVYILDPEGCFTFVNNEIVERFGRPKEWFIGRHYLQVVRPEYRDLAQRNFDAEMRGDVLPPYEIMIDIPGSKERVWVEVNRQPLYDGTRIIGVLGVSRDITSRKLMEEELKRHKDHLEHKVEERTAELKTSKEELEIKTRTLEEVNTALKVLLRQREEDKVDLEERFALNVRKLILPYVEKMKKGRLDPQLHSYVSIMEANLNEIMSPFLHSVGQFNLTPREAQVASLIKDGKTTKEIAEIIGIAPSAVDSHRNNIRSKLSLNKRKVNLQMYLQSMK